MDLSGEAAAYSGKSTAAAEGVLCPLPSDCQQWLCCFLAQLRLFTLRPCADTQTAQAPEADANQQRSDELKTFLRAWCLRSVDVGPSSGMHCIGTAASCTNRSACLKFGSRAVITYIQTVLLALQVMVSVGNGAAGAL